MNYLLVDLSNLYFRARHVAHRQSALDDRLGMSLHLSLGSVMKPWREFSMNAHVVFALEGRSWRKEIYKPYKAKRAEQRAALTDKEKEEDKLYWETYEELVDFLKTKTNCTCLYHPNLEADDLIAGWIQSHPNDKHCIVSSDTDFYQLIADNVIQYNGITDEMITLDGYFDTRGNQIIDKKTKEPKRLPDPKWILFEKCIRGDASDNIFSAYPGVRIKGTKNKVGLREAFSDRDSKGFAWNNLMLQRWTDHEGNEHRVFDDYIRNVSLIDLTAQPDHVKIMMAETIAAAQEHKQVSNIGVYFMKFCGKHRLNKLAEQSDMFARIFSTGYGEGS